MNENITVPESRIPSWPTPYDEKGRTAKELYREVIDDVLPQEQSDWLSRTVMNKSSKWGYIEDSSGTVPDGARKFPSFAKPVFNDEDPRKILDQQWMDLLECPLYTLAAKGGQDCRKMTRVRLGMHVPDGSWTGPHGPHVDQTRPHMVILYYCNDSDGDTFFFERDHKTIIDRVSPKKNRMVVFDGMTPHASSYPTTPYRVTINLNFYTAEEPSFNMANVGMDHFAGTVHRKSKLSDPSHTYNLNGNY